MTFSIFRSRCSFGTRASRSTITTSFRPSLLHSSIQNTSVSFIIPETEVFLWFFDKLCRGKEPLGSFPLLRLYCDQRLPQCVRGLCGYKSVPAFW